MPKTPYGLADPAVAQACPGLVAGWRIGDGPACRLSPEAALAALQGGQPPAWLHFDLTHAGARPLLAAAAGLPPGARHALVEAEEHPWIETQERAMFGCVPDLADEEEASGQPGLAVLRFVLAPGLLVTARRHRLRALARFEHPPEGLSPEALLARILRAVLGDVLGLQREMSARIERLEEHLLRDGAGVQRPVLGEIRRGILRLSRTLDPLLLSIETLEEEDMEGGWMAPAGQAALREALHRMRVAGRSIAALQERARIAQDDMASRAAEETNRRLFVLSVISAVMLPASLIAGIFGMNVGELPGVEQSWGFVMAMGLIVASIAATLGLLRAFRLM
ncbi:CorA family divalent cation transporter [Roseicella frigidaeris]|uniref:Magnesium transporter n=1 Tax=Roseicella frigidaeris TaxID=2230885 RepID=A0A327M749_9PROT|nr:CorA family divalent cation transporter [Roseicella frigidaeris]RAI58297.1 hypothetical protein DOO78_14895 [Roseicella frigidaeris]